MRCAPLLFSLVLVSLSACSGDHDQLAAGPLGARDAGEEPISDAALEDPDDLDADDPADASEEPLPPPGPFVLTIVNGMPDAPAVRLCFVPVIEGREEPPASPPLPESGLAYGAKIVLDEVALVSLGETALRPYVVSGELSHAQGASCRELLNDQKEGLALSPLPILPAGTFAKGRSALLVTTGCVGGEGHVASGQQLVCGEGYAPESPTASLVLLAMSRESSPSKIGLQAAHAFASTAPVAIEIAPAEGFTPVTVTASALPSTITPKPPAFSYDKASFDALVSQGVIHVNETQTSSTLVTIPLREAIKNGDLGQADIVAGKNYTLVAVGPAPQVEKGPWWSGFTVVLVESGPEP